ncbi:alpha-L-fucosidase [Planctomycetota bacterium]
MIVKQTLSLFTLLLGIAGVTQAANATAFEGPYQANWESLQKHECAPQWLRDAKFGIYWHWGVYSVPAFGNEWYPRKMYNPESDVYRFHKATYGDPQTFGYHDLVPLWQAPHFDPNRWADLCVQAGARFAGSIAVHHDNFLLWDSELSPWNSVQMGPNIDVVGESAKAIKARGLKFFASFHHAWTSKYYEFAYRHAGASVGQHPGLYTEPWQGKEHVSSAYRDLWLNKVQEVITKYEPDMLYFDWGLERLIDTPHHQALFASYYNWAHSQQKEVAITLQPGEIQKHTGLYDYTWRQPATISNTPFTTDDTIAQGSWSYTKNMTLKSPHRLLTDLIDVISKNGIFLLNISPMANGTIPADQQKILIEIGQWLKQYGEAIYNTHPWSTYGEGPSTTPTQALFVNRRKAPVEYTAQDIRYTQSKDNTVIYAIQLNISERHSPLVLHAFSLADRPKDLSIQKVQVLGSDPVEWRLTDQGLRISPPLPSSEHRVVVYQILVAENQSPAK